MLIKSLDTVAFEEVMQCFLSSFDNYFVQLPTDQSYWRRRFILARVDWELSFGIFDENYLVGFIIHGVDNYQGQLTAYNTGTGILPAYRGRGLIKEMYDFALPFLIKKGVERCLLEVIVENEIAIKAYQKTGFKITRELRSYGGGSGEEASEIELEECEYQKVLGMGSYQPQHYSWDNAAEAIQVANNVKTFLVPKAGGIYLGFFSIDDSGNVLQLESPQHEYSKLLSAIGSISNKIRIKNVWAERKELISELEHKNFINTVNQYEMELVLPRT